MTKLLQTSKLEVAYQESGDADGKPLILLHGWPDSPHGWDAVVAGLCDRGFRCFLPCLRGFGETRFLSSAEPRSGQATALASDVLEFADALGLDSFDLAGHDWGAFAAYLAAVIAPGRVRKLVTLSVPYGINTPHQPPPLMQARAFWYQWLFQTPQGRQMLEHDRTAFCRFIWQTWMPDNPIDETAFEQASIAWQNPDWVNVTLHYYRNRWGSAIEDPAYEHLEAIRHHPPVIDTPTVLIHGANDPCILAATTDDRDAFFSGGYKRILLPGVGHFPQRERPQQVQAIMLDFLTAADSSPNG